MFIYSIRDAIVPACTENIVSREREIPKKYMDNLCKSEDNDTKTKNPKVCIIICNSS